MYTVALSQSVRMGCVTALLIAFGSLTAGCAKNVERFSDFNKWGHSYVPRGSSIETTAQGGGTQNNITPSSANHAVPKASVGGTYHRTFATSPSYRMVGGFHVTPQSQ